MSDRACIYCGRSLDDPGWTDSREIAQGYHQYCHAGTSQGRHRAEYAALAAGLDAVRAEYEALLERLAIEDSAILTQHKRRALAAEARIAEQDRLIHDGIYALMGERHAALTRAAAVWEERALAAEAQLAHARADQRVLGAPAADRRLRAVQPVATVARPGPRGRGAEHGVAHCTPSGDASTAVL